MSLRSFAFAAFGLFAAAPALAQDAVANGARFGAWTVSCEALGKDRTACVLVQRLNRDSDGAFIAQMLAFWSADGTKAYVGARVPTGAYLPTGFAIQAPGAEQSVPFIWQSCNGTICEALREIDVEAMGAFDTTEGAVLGRFRPRLGMEPLVFSFSMQGVTDGLVALFPDSE